MRWLPQCPRCQVRWLWAAWRLARRPPPAAACAPARRLLPHTTWPAGGQAQRSLAAHARSRSACCCYFPPLLPDAMAVGSRMMCAWRAMSPRLVTSQPGPPAIARGADGAVCHRPGGSLWQSSPKRSRAHMGRRPGYEVSALRRQTPHAVKACRPHAHTRGVLSPAPCSPRLTIRCGADGQLGRSWWPRGVQAQLVQLHCCLKQVLVALCLSLGVDPAKTGLWVGGWVGAWVAGRAGGGGRVGRHQAGSQEGATSADLRPGALTDWPLLLCDQHPPTAHVCATAFAGLAFTPARYPQATANSQQHAHQSLPQM